VRKVNAFLAHFGGARECEAGNTVDPMTGSRVQQTCRRKAEQRVEVVRNHEDAHGWKRHRAFGQGVVSPRERGP